MNNVKSDKWKNDCSNSIKLKTWDPQVNFYYASQKALHVLKSKNTNRRKKGEEARNSTNDSRPNSYLKAWWCCCCCRLLIMGNISTFVNWQLFLLVSMGKPLLTFQGIYVLTYYPYLQVHLMYALQKLATLIYVLYLIIIQTCWDLQNQSSKVFHPSPMTQEKYLLLEQINEPLDI